MIKLFFCLLIFIASGSVWTPHFYGANQEKTLIFEDDFNRNESVESKEELGNGWQTNSKSRAKGNKQADLRDSTLHIYRHQVADHGVSVRHPIEFQDGRIEMKFKLENKGDSLGVNIADMKEKSVHAGHLFKVIVKRNQLEIADLKTGVMDLAIRTARKSGKELSESQKEQLKGKSKKVPVKLNLNQWYEFAMQVTGESCEVWIDGQSHFKFSSPGIGHPTKQMLRLAIAKQVVIDDLKVYRIDQ